MSKKKILILGSTGLLGKDLYNLFIQDESFEISSISRNNQLDRQNHYVFDLQNTDSITKIVNKINPQIIINAAANVNLESCEINKEYTKKIHVDLVNALTKSTNIEIFIQISTDSVFDGTKSNYKETDLPNPLNYYASTKYEAEKIILESKIKNILILRTNMIGFGSNTNNSFFEWAYKNIVQNNFINGYENVIFNPLYTQSIAEIVLIAIKKSLFEYKLLHIGSANYISKYNLLNLISEKLNSNKGLIKKIKLVDENVTILRPHNTSLNCDLFSKVFSTELTQVEDQLDKLLLNFKKYKHEF
jgi:dTDP-4-dehydrorhamnose reductase